MEISALCLIVNCHTYLNLCQFIIRNSFKASESPFKLEYAFPMWFQFHQAHILKQSNNDFQNTLATEKQSPF